MKIQSAVPLFCAARHSAAEVGDQLDKADMAEVATFANAFESDEPHQLGVIAELNIFRCDSYLLTYLDY